MKAVADADVEGCNKVDLLTYFIAAPPDRGWQRNEGLLLLHSFLSLVFDKQGGGHSTGSRPSVVPAAVLLSVWVQPHLQALRGYGVGRPGAPEQRAAGPALHDDDIGNALVIDLINDSE